MDAIAAVIIGGVSVCQWSGTVIGALFIAVIAVASTF